MMPVSWMPLMVWAMPTPVKDGIRGEAFPVATALRRAAEGTGDRAELDGNTLALVLLGHRLAAVVEKRSCRRWRQRSRREGKRSLIGEAAHRRASPGDTCCGGAETWGPSRLPDALLSPPSYDSILRVGNGAALVSALTTATRNDHSEGR